MKPIFVFIALMIGCFLNAETITLIVSPANQSPLIAFSPSIRKLSPLKIEIVKIDNNQEILFWEGQSNTLNDIDINVPKGNYKIYVEDSVNGIITEFHNFDTGFYTIKKGAPPAQINIFESYEKANRIKQETQRKRKNIKFAPNQKQIEDELLIKYNPDLKINQKKRLNNKNNIEIYGKNSKINFYKVKIKKPDKKAEIIIQDLIKSGSIKYVEPNYISNVLEIKTNDTYFDKQWYLQSLNISKAWGIEKGRADVKIAVLDSGIDKEHNDLKNRIIEGYNIIDNDTDTTDNNGHGTLVSGIIGAVPDNGKGISGITWYCPIMPVKVIDANGFGLYSELADGIIYAADRGADIINLSIGGYEYSRALQESVDYAYEKGAVLVAAGGNTGKKDIIYPAAYNNVIGVAGLANDTELAPFSTTGEHISIAAPGVNIISTWLENQYKISNGSSLAAACVSGIAGLVKSNNLELKNYEIIYKLEQSCIDIGLPGKDDEFGYGRINPEKALINSETMSYDLNIIGLKVKNGFSDTFDNFTVCAIVQNQGKYSEDFFIDFYVENEQQINTGPFELDAGDSELIFFEFKLNPQETEKIYLKAIIRNNNDKNLSNNEKKIQVLTGKSKDGKVWIMYTINPPTHQYIAQQAQYVWTDMPQEMKGHLTNSIYNELTGYNDQYDFGEDIIKGAQEEDYLSGGTPFNHFWEPDNRQSGGYDVGLLGSGSSYRHAQDIWNEEVLVWYYLGFKDEAYYWLGRMAHLLMDMTVPAHMHLDPHSNFPDDDIYEYFMANDNGWGSTLQYYWEDEIGQNGITADSENFYHFKGIDYAGQEYDYENLNINIDWNGIAYNSSALFKLCWYTAQKTQYFPSDDYDANQVYEDILNLTWDFPENTFWDSMTNIPTRAELLQDESNNEGPTVAAMSEKLMPHAMKAVAGLYRLFWNTTHPQISILNLSSGNVSGTVTIEAQITVATDTYFVVYQLLPDTTQFYYMYDDGPGGGHGDKNAGDNIYTAEWNTTSETEGLLDTLVVGVGTCPTPSWEIYFEGEDSIPNITVKNLSTLNAEKIGNSYILTGETIFLQCTDFLNSGFTYNWEVSQETGVYFSNRNETSTYFSSSAVGLYKVKLKATKMFYENYTDTFFIRVVNKKGDVAGAGISNIEPDGKIDIEDIKMLTKYFHTKSGDSNFDASMDINSDSKIDLEDIMEVGKNYGK